MIEFFFDPEGERDPVRRGEMTEERTIAGLMIFNRSKISAGGKVDARDRERQQRRPSRDSSRRLRAW